MKSITFLLLAMVMLLQAMTILSERGIIGFDPSLSLGGTNSRFLSSKSKRVRMKCNKYPRVCRMSGSPGPDCCKKKCVNVMKDRVNCGMCGKKCKYAEICCKGVCARPASDQKNCGGCGNKCKKGIACIYGICSYS